MPNVVFAGSTIGSTSSSLGVDVDATGITDGDVLIWNDATQRLEPYTQAGNTAQQSFDNLIATIIGPPTTQLT